MGTSFCRRELFRLNVLNNHLMIGNYHFDFPTILIVIQSDTAFVIYYENKTPRIVLFCANLGGIIQLESDRSRRFCLFCKS